MNRQIASVMLIVLLATSISIAFLNPATATPIATTRNVPSQYATIQSAINAAGAFDIIDVAAGIYNENLNINKQLTLNGPNAAVNPNTGSRGTEAIITGTVTVTSDGVTFTGFTVTNPNGNGLYAVDKSSLTVANNIFNNIGTSLSSGTSQAVYVKSSSLSIDAITIQNNLISNVGTTTTGSNKGIFIGDSNGAYTVSNVQISGNVISSVVASSSKGAYGVEISYGAYAAGSVTGLQITNNKISALSGQWTHAIGLETKTPSATITGNIISGLTATLPAPEPFGVYIEDNPNAATVAIHNNQFAASITGVGQNTATAPGIVNAEANYWGSAYPEFANKVFGTVDFSPYYSDASLITSQQITVGSTIGTSNFQTIQSAINMAQTGDGISVLAGTYNENVNIDESVILMGQGFDISTVWSNPQAPLAAEVIINGGVTINANQAGLFGFAIHNPTGSTGVLINRVSTVYVLSNIIDGVNTEGTGSAQGIYILGGSNPIATFYIAGNRISNIGNHDLTKDSSGSSAKGIFIGDSTGTSTIDGFMIVNNVISSVYASTADYSSGGRGAYGILANYGSATGAGGQVTDLLVAYNAISGLEGYWVHAVGLEADTPDSAVSSNTISGLVDPQNPSASVGVWFEANPSAGTVEVSDNKFDAATVYWGVALHPALTGVIVDASDNWWGSSSGPNSEGWTYGSTTVDPHTGSGDHVGAYVIYDDWITQPVTITASAGAGGSIDPVGPTSVNYGDSKTYTITPDTGYHVADVQVDGHSVGAVTTYTFTDTIADHTISATFDLNYVPPSSYTITASAGTGGSISPTGATAVIAGDNQVYTITPNTGYHIADVLVDGASVGAVSSYNFTNAQAPHTIAAIFVINTYIITASTGTGGSITPTATVNYGASQTFNITANTGYHIVSVTVDGGLVGSVTSYTFTNVTAAHTIAATFAINTVIITATAGVNGGITPSGATSVNIGSTQTFNMTANTGYHIDNITVDGTAVGAVSSYTLTNVTTAHSIAVTFAINTYIVTVTPGAGGAISPGTGSVNYGSNPTFTITPNSGYQIADVLVDGVLVGVVSSYSFTNVQATHTISASFTRPQLTLTVTPTTAAIDATVSRTFAATAAGGSGSYSYKWMLNGAAIDGATAATYTFASQTAGTNTLAVTVTDSDGRTATASATVTVAASTSTPTTITGGKATVDNTQTTGVSVTVQGSSIPDGTSINVYTASFGSTQPTDTGGLQLNINAAAFYDVQVNSTTTLAPNTLVTVNFTDPSFGPEDNIISYWNGTAWVTVPSVFIPDHTISATFPASALTGTRIMIGQTTTVVTHKITTSNGAGGAITPSGNITATDGSNITFTITPNNGYQITDVLVDGISVGAVTNYTLTNITGDHTVTATFTQISQTTNKDIPPGYIAGAAIAAIAAAVLIFLFVVRSRQKK